MNIRSPSMCSAILCVGLMAAAQAGEIHDAVANGDTLKVQLLLFASPSLISAQNNNQETPLHVACHRGKLEIARFLLARGADVNAIAYNGFTPLHLTDDPQIVRAVLRHKPDLKIIGGIADGGQTVLERAAERFSFGGEDRESWRAIVKLLLDAGAPYDLWSAIYLDDIERVRVLIKDDPDLVHDRKTPLVIAARRGRTAICRILLQHGADPDNFEKGNGFPIILHGVAHPEVVKVLIEAGANLKKRITWTAGRSGMWYVGDDATILHYAAKHGVVESARILIEHGVPVDALDKDRQTALHIAATFSKPDMVRFLLERGADPIAKRKDGLTPLDLVGIWRPRGPGEQETRKILESASKATRTRPK